MLQPGDRMGDWIVERRLGAGGMGSVYLCRGVLSERVRAALKVLHADDAVATRERFVREVDTLAQLDHPSVVRVLSGGTDPDRGLLYLFMEYLEGDDLESRLSKGPLSAAEAYNVFRQAAEGLAHAHVRRVTHRDIKPANIMLTPEGTAKLVDFGIAVAEGHTRLTREGTLPGTLPYVDPVAFQGEAPDPYLGDVYAMGLVLYEALTGRRAFPENPDLSGGQSFAAMIGAKLQAEAFDPGPGFPDKLRRLVMRATEPEPEDRLASMDEFLSQLNAAYVGRPELSARSTGDALNPPASPRPRPAASQVAPAPQQRRRLWPWVVGGSMVVVVLALVVVVLLAPTLLVAGLGLSMLWGTTPTSSPSSTGDLLTTVASEGGTDLGTLADLPVDATIQATAERLGQSIDADDTSLSLSLSGAPFDGATLSWEEEHPEHLSGLTLFAQSPPAQGPAVVERLQSHLGPRLGQWEDGSWMFSWAEASCHVSESVDVVACSVDPEADPLWQPRMAVLYRVALQAASGSDARIPVEDQVRYLGSGQRPALLSRLDVHMDVDQARERVPDELVGSYEEIFIDVDLHVPLDHAWLSEVELAWANEAGGRLEDVSISPPAGQGDFPELEALRDCLASHLGPPQEHELDHAAGTVYWSWERGGGESDVTLHPHALSFDVYGPWSESPTQESWAEVWMALDGCGPR